MKRLLANFQILQKTVGRHRRMSPKMVSGLFITIILLFPVIAIVPVSLAQDDPVPTLVPPTPVPVEPTGEPDFVISESTVARLQRDGVVRVGVLYNEIPFGQYTVQGEVTGFDADLARLLAETWDVELELIQVTRQNRFDLLSNGTVDMLLAAVVHERSLDARFEFSQTYRLGGQVLMVEADSEIASIFNLGGQTVGYVVGTEGQTALNNWMASSGIQVQTRAYLTFDEMLSGLFGGEVVAIAGRDTRLYRTALPVLDAVQVLDTPLQEEAFGIVMLRQDLHLRNLVNRTLQYLASDADLGQESTLEQLHAEYFPNDEFPYAALPIYTNVGDEAPQLAQFPADVPLPQIYAATTIINNGVVRVAGLQNPDTLPPEEVFVANANRAVIEQMASRWGVQIQVIDGDPIQAVANGQADIAVGITPDWNAAANVDFSQPYVQHGRRLMYPEGRDLDRLGDLFATTRIVATISGDEGAQELANSWAEFVGIFNMRFFETSLDNAADTILEDNNALVVFADSFLLLPIVRENPTDLAIGPTWYDRQFLTFALPQNDIDFRRLVNYTLQEMVADQSLTTLTVPIIPEGERAPQIGIWSGSSEYLGLNLGR